MAIDSIIQRAKQHAAKPARMVNRVIDPMTVRLDEIPEIIARNPEHPASKGLLEFYEEHAGFPGGTPVAIDRPVILAICENCNLRDQVTYTGNRPIHTKTIEK